MENTRLKVLFLLQILTVVLITIQLFYLLLSQISKWFFQPSSVERQRFEDGVRLKAEMKKLSMVDDFAAYSKLQRKLNLVTLGLETDGKIILILNS